jgi:hypothetical protein
MKTFWYAEWYAEAMAFINLRMRISVGITNLGQRNCQYWFYSFYWDTVLSCLAVHAIIVTKTSARTTTKCDVI